MSLTADDFEQYFRDNGADEPLGDGLNALAIDIESDAVEDVRSLREQT